MKALNIIVLILVIIGAIVLGILGIVNPKPINVFPGANILAIIIGLAGLYAISFFGKIAQ